jgi:hypothetical protein
MGVAGRLIDFAMQELRVRGVPYACLIPQNAKLFAYYRKFGFAPVLYAQHFTEALSAKLVAANDGDVGFLNAVYEDALDGVAHVTRSAEHWSQIIKECHLGGGNVWIYKGNAGNSGNGGSFGNGYAVCPRDNMIAIECFGLGDVPSRRDGVGAFRVVGAASAEESLRQAEALFGGQGAYMQLMHSF